MAKKNNKKEIRFSIGFDVDKKSLSDISKELQNLATITNSSLKVDGISLANEDLKEVRNTASKVGEALERAYNPKIDSVNVSKFNQELNKSNLDIKKVYDNLSKAGPKGAATFNSLASSLLQVNEELRESKTLFDEMVQTFTNTVKWNIASSLVNNLSGRLQSAISYVENLDTSLNDIRIVTGYAADEMDKFAVKANNAAGALGKSTLDYTKAALTYYQQGLSDEEVQARTEVTLKTANVTGQGTADTAEQLTAVWNGYEVAAEDTELYVDKLAAVGAATASDLQELSEGMSKVASLANSMGVDIDQLNAILATTVSVTRQDASSIGNAYKTVFSRIADIKAGTDEAEVSLGEYSGRMAEVGISVLDNVGELRDMGEVMEEVGDKWQDLTREQQVYLAQTMAGTRQANNLVALFNNWDMYKDALETSKNATGTLQEQQDIYMESTAAHLKQLTNAWDKLYSAALDSDTINAVVDGLTVIVDLAGSFIENLGGGIDTLKIFGGLATQIFGKQIANSLSTTFNNLQISKNNQKAYEDSLMMSKELSIKDDKGNFVYGDSVGQLAKIFTEIDKIYDSLNPKQKEYVKELQKAAAAALEQKAIVQNRLSDAESRIKNSSVGDIAVQDKEGKNKALKDIFSDSNYFKLDNLTEDMKSNFSDVSAELYDIQEELENQVKVLEKLKELSGDYANGFEDFDYDDAYAITKTLKENIESLGIKGGAEKSKELNKEYEELYQKAYLESEDNKDSNGKKIYSTWEAAKKGWGLTEDEVLVFYASIYENNEKLRGDIEKLAAKAKKATSETKGEIEKVGEAMADVANNTGEGAEGAAAWPGVNEKLSEVLKNSAVQLGQLATQGIQAGTAIASLSTSIENGADAIIGMKDGTISASDGLQKLGGVLITLVPQVKMLINTFGGPWGWAIATAGVAVGALTSYLKIQAEAAEKAGEKLEESVDSYNEATKNLKNYNDELKTNAERLKELNAISLEDRTKEQKEEIENIEKENALLKTQIALEELKRKNALNDTVKNYKEAEKAGTYEDVIDGADFTVRGWSKYQIENNPSGTKKINYFDDKAWNDYLTDRYAEADEMASEESKQLVLDQIKEAENAREAARQKMLSTVDFSFLQEVVEAYKELGEEVPESLKTAFANIMKAAGTIEDTVDIKLQGVIGKDIEKFNRLSIYAKFARQRQEWGYEDYSEQDWANYLSKDYELVKTAADDLNISVNDLMLNFNSGNVNFENFTEETKAATEELAKFKGAAEDSIESLGELVSKMQTKGLDSLSDNEIEELESLEKELAKLGGKYEDLATLRKASETDYIDLIKRGREELREYNTIQAADNVVDKAFNKYIGSGKISRSKTLKVDQTDSLAELAAFSQELMDASLDFEIQIRTNFEESANEFIDYRDTLQSGLDMIDENLQISGDSLVELQRIFPETAGLILDNLQDVGNGLYQIPQKIYEEFKTANQNILSNQKVTLQEKIKLQIDEYDSQIQVLDNTIAALETYSEIDGKTSEDAVLAKQAIDEANEKVANNVIGYAVDAADEQKEIEGDFSEDSLENLQNTLVEKAKMWNKYYWSLEDMAEQWVENEKKLVAGEAAQWMPKGTWLENNYTYSKPIGDVGEAGVVDSGEDIVVEDLTDEELKDLIDRYKTQKTSLAQNRDYLKALLKQLEGSSKFESSGNGSSKSSLKELESLENEIDAYHDINREIQLLENEMSLLQAQQKNLFGTDLIDNYANQIANLNEQYKAQQELLKVNQNVIDKTKSLMEDWSLKLGEETFKIEFDERGQIVDSEGLKDKVTNAFNTKWSGQEIAEDSSEWQQYQDDLADYEAMLAYIETYEKALNETGPEAEIALENLKAQIIDTLAAASDISQYEIPDKVLQDLTLVDELFGELETGLDKINDLLEESTQLSDSFGSEFTDSVKNAKEALTGQLLIGLIKTTKQVYDLRQEYEKITKVDPFNYSKDIEAAQKSLTPFHDELVKIQETEGELPQGAQDFLSIWKEFNNFKLDFSSVGGFIDSIKTGTNLFSRLNEIKNQLIEDSSSGMLNDMVKGVVDTGVDTLEPVLTNLNSVMSSSVMGYVSLVTGAVEAVYQLASIINNYVTEIQKLRMAEMNLEADTAISNIEGLEKWQSFRRLLEDIDESDYLGQLKQDIRDIAEQLSGLSFDSTSIQGLDMISVKANLAESSISVLTNKVQNLSAALMDGSYVDQYATGIFWWRDNNRDVAIEDLQEYTDALMDEMESLADLINNAEKTYLDSWNNIQDNLEEQLDRYDNLLDTIDNKKNIMKLMYGDDAYTELKDWYELETSVNNSRLSYQKSMVEYWEKYMNELEEGSEAWKIAQENWQDALNNLNDSLEDAIQTIIDKYENAVNEIFDKMTENLTNGSGLDWLGTQYDLMKEQSDRYLDDVNKSYSILSLQTKFMDAINAAEGNAKAQADIKKLMNEQLSSLKEKDKLTQYDVERAEKLLQIEQARQALQDAKNNTSKMRLARDAQGNYSYQYVADDNAISDAQQKLLDAQNDLYNFDKDQYMSNLNDMQNAYQEYIDKMTEIATNQSLSETERQEQMKEVTAQYQEYLTAITQENTQIRENLANSAYDSYFNLLYDSKDEFLNVSDEMLGEVIPAWDSAIQEMIEKISTDEDSFRNTTTEALEEIIKLQQQYTQDIEDTKEAIGGIDFTDVKAEMSELQALSDALKKKNDEIIDTYTKEAEELIKLNEQLAEMRDYWNEIAVAAKEAAEASMNVQYKSEKDSKNNTASNAAITAGTTASGAAIGAAIGGVPGAIIGGIAGLLGGGLISHFRNAASYATGGYTGDEITDDGALAILHKKELILNEDDTANMLDMLKLSREIQDRGRVAAGVYTADLDTSAIKAETAAQQIDQNVHIEANFPNVTNHTEIETALTNLVNTASQRAMVGTDIVSADIGKLASSDLIWYNN